MQSSRASTIEDSNRTLEQAIVEEYLRALGLSPEAVSLLPADTAREVMVRAAGAAAARMTEIECRAHWLSGIHHHA